MSTPEDLGNQIADSIIKAFDIIAKPDWIPAEERLPDVGVRVLVLWDGSCAMVCERYDEDWWSYCEGQTKSMPTHWMPLPEPPQ